MTTGVLTDSELEALAEIAEQFHHAPPDVGEYRLIDFAARETGVLRQMTLLSVMHQRHAEQLGAQLADAFGLRFSVTADAPRLTSFGDLFMALESDPAVLSVCLKPLRGVCYIVCPADLLSLLVNQLFGGGANHPPGQRSRKGLTPGEQRLSELLGERVLHSLTRAWNEKLVLAPEQLTALPNTDKLAAEPTENLALNLDLSLSCDDWQGVVQLIIPFASIEPFKQRLSQAILPVDQASGDGIWAESLSEHLPAVHMLICAQLTGMELSLGEILTLRTGTLLPLELPDTVTVTVESEPYCSGHYGRSKGKKAIKIHTVYGPGEPGS